MANRASVRPGEHCDRCQKVHEPLPRCQAHRKSGDKGQCSGQALRGRNVCRFHGGKTPRGVASPHWQGRGYSKALPVHLRDAFETALQDPELLALDREIALTEARLTQLAERLDGEDPKALAQQVLTKLNEMRQAWDGGRLQDFQQKLAEVTLAAEAIKAQERAWSDVLTWQEQRRRLADTERRRREAIAAYVTTERMVAMVAMLVEIMRRHISDRDVFRRVTADVQALLEAKPQT